MPKGLKKLNSTLLTRNRGAERVCYRTKKISAASEQVASDRRARRHAVSQATPAGPACPQCDRIGASDFGLRSHSRSHRRPQNWHPGSTTSWLKSSDYCKQEVYFTHNPLLHQIAGARQTVISILYTKTPQLRHGLGEPVVPLSIRHRWEMHLAGS